MNFADCLRAAVAAGELDRDHAELAIDRWKKRSEFHQREGKSDLEARRMATDDVVGSITRAIQRDRHIKARQLAVLQRNTARYANADPELLIRDMQALKFEADAILKMRMAGMSDMLAHHEKNLFGRNADPAGERALVLELHGEDSGNAHAKAYALAVKAEREWMRSTLNSLGADIQKLDDYGLAHTHDAQLVRKADFEKWSDDIWDKLDWNRIENFETGKLFSSEKGGLPAKAAAKKFLLPIFHEITSEGWADRTPGFAMGTRSLADDGAGHRVLHFRHADDWFDYNEVYGKKNVMDAIMDEFRGRSTDIARMRAFGPNPRAGVENAIQVLTKSASIKTFAGREGTLVERAAGFGLHPKEHVERVANTARLMHGTLTGELNQPANRALAALMAGSRGFLTAALLGRASLSQLSDFGSMRNAAKAAGFNPTSPVMNTLKSIFSGTTRRQAVELGFILESQINADIAEIRRTGGIWHPAWSRRFSNGIQRISAMTLLTNSGRRGIAMGLGSDLAERAHLGWGELDELTRRFFAENDLDARLWDRIRDPRVIYTDAVGGKHINPKHFRILTDLPDAEADDVAIRLGALFEAHIQQSAPNADLKATALVLGRTQPGSVSGELARSGMMFKSTAIASLFNLIRQTHRHTGWRAQTAYVVSAMGVMTLSGALVMQLKELAKGRDPLPMNDYKFWMRAFFQGGGVGILGDFVVASTSRAGGGLHETFAGPVIGAASDVGRFLGNVGAAVEGKETHFARDGIRLVHRYNPFATLLPVAAATEHLLWDQLEIIFDPRARSDFARAEAKMKREQGNQSWYRRGEMLPHRLPDFSNIFGGTP